MRPSWWSILIIVVALVLLFGWRRLPDMARSVGQSMRIFKSEVEQMSDKDKDAPSAASTDTVRGTSTDPLRDTRTDHLRGGSSDPTVDPERPRTPGAGATDPGARYDGPPRA